MRWSRIDSGFWRHPKFAGWKPEQKWALGELIGYCCEYRTDGVIPNDMTLLPRSITEKFLALATDSGWVDVDEEGVRRIHDWADYHPADPTAADRMKRHRRNKERNGTVTEGVTTITNTITNTKQVQKQDLPPTNSIDRLLAACTDARPGTKQSVWALANRHNLHDADFEVAREAAMSSSADSPTAVAISVLRSRGEAKGAAA